MSKKKQKPNRINALLSLGIVPAAMLLHPFATSTKQAFVLGSLFTVVLWWATGWVKRDHASLALIAVFLLCGDTPAKAVLNFPLSGNIVMIAAAYLLSEGIVKSGAADAFSEYILGRYCKTYAHMVAASFVLCALLIFAIPQPFPRVVLLSAIYTNYLKQHRISGEKRSAVLFSIFVAATVTSLLFLNGDIVANYAALEFAGVSLSFAAWAKYMAVPTLGASLLTLLAYVGVFRKELAGALEDDEAGATHVPDISEAAAAYVPDSNGTGAIHMPDFIDAGATRVQDSSDAGAAYVLDSSDGEAAHWPASNGIGGPCAPLAGSSMEHCKPKLDKKGKRALFATGTVVLLWLSEPVHGYNAAAVAAAGVGLMFALRLLGLKDVRVISGSLLLFLTAQFAIGRVLVASGIAEQMRGALSAVLPDVACVWFLPAVALLVMLVHMLLGGVITTLSFSIPMLLVIADGVYAPEFVALFVLASAGYHFLLPFHHVTVMIGFGSGYYENRHVLRFGTVISVVVFASLFLLYIPWWKLTGLF